MNTINNDKIIWLYWNGAEKKLIVLLRKIMILHSDNGKNYKINLVTSKNIELFIDKRDIPNYFYNLRYAHQADYVRIYVLYKYGGIWLDSDTLVMNNLNELFDLLKIHMGFVVAYDHDDAVIDGQMQVHLCNTVIGSKSNTQILQSWLIDMLKILDEKHENIRWDEIGGEIMRYMSDNFLRNNYNIVFGKKSIIPVHFLQIVYEFITKPYENYIKLIRELQPILLLNNVTYGLLEKLTEREIINGNTPLNYFINKSFENMKHLKDYDFIEINDDTINIEEFYYKKNIRTIKILEINVNYDNMLIDLYNHLKYLPNIFFPIKIKCKYIKTDIIESYKLLNYIYDNNELNVNFK